MPEISSLPTKEDNSYNSWLSKYFKSRRTGKVYTTKFALYDTADDNDHKTYGVKMDDNENIKNPTPIGVSLSYNENTGDFDRTFYNTNSPISNYNSFTKSGDPYDNEPLFEHYDCRWVLDTDGNIIITDLDYPEMDRENPFDRKAFQKYTLNDGNNTSRVENIGVVYPAWYVKTWKDVIYWYVSITDSPLEGYLPMCACVKPRVNGNTIPDQDFQVRSKYMLGNHYDNDDNENYPVSLSGYRPRGGAVPSGEGGSAPSFQNLITYCQKLGKVYGGTTADDWFFIQLLFIIKYATLDSQSNTSNCMSIAGCTKYDYMFAIQPVNNQPSNSFKLDKSNADKLIIGSSISSGTMAYSRNTIRDSSSYTSFYSRQILSIEDDIENENKSIVTVSGDSFTIPVNNPNTRISTMPYYSGLLDEIHSDGGLYGHITDGNGPGIIGGIEFGVGGFEVLGNIILYSTSIGSSYKRNIYIHHNTKEVTINTPINNNLYKLSDYEIPVITGDTSQDITRYIYEEEIDIINGIMIPTVIDTKSVSTPISFQDMAYTGQSTGGTFGFRVFGFLGSGSYSGAWRINVDQSLNSTDWLNLSRISPNGMYGTRED